MESTIHKDMEEVDKKISELVSKLNSERMIQIKKKVGICTYFEEYKSVNVDFFTLYRYIILFYFTYVTC